MKNLVLLILLLFWDHVCGQWLHCSTGVVTTNQAISLLSSTHAGAKVLLLRKYQAHSLIDCLEECCSGKLGLCSVVEYRNKSADANCLYYSCQPIQKCKFIDSEGTDTFTFPSVKQDLSLENNTVSHDAAVGYTKLKTIPLNENSSIHQSKQRTFKDHTRAVTARKGVEPFTTAASDEEGLASWKEVHTERLENGGISKLSDNFKDHTQTVTARKGVETTASAPDGGSSISWKGVSSIYLVNGSHSKSSDELVIQDILSKTDVSLKNDNTTIKPRKGVYSEAELISPKIKPRKGVEALNSSESLKSPEISRSKVKPRKGAVPFPFSLTETPAADKTPFIETFQEPSSTPTAPVISLNSLNQTLPSHVSLSTDLISVLEEVFRDELPSLGTKSRYDTHAPGISATSSFTINSSPVSSSKYNGYTTFPSNSAVTVPSSAPGIAESSSKPFYTISPSRSSGYHDKALKSTPPLASISEHLKHQPASSAHDDRHTPDPSHSPALRTSMNAESSILSQETLHHRGNAAVLLFTVSSRNMTKMPLMSAVDDSESERKYKSSMHLVLSLVFGLLVLFAVFGAVAKRVYDVWMRRHYHRMDFLIDGMYDGFS